MNKLLPLALVFAITGCAVDADPVDEDPSVSETEALVASVLVPVTKLSLNVSLPITGVRVFKTAAEFRAALRTEPSGIDFSREWAVYYSAGNNLMTSTPTVAASRSGDGTVLNVTGLLRSPGKGCLTPLPARVPYFVGKIARAGLSLRGPTVRTYLDRTIVPCTGTVDLDHCALTGCPAGQVCRVVDGVDGCVQAPPACGMVVCPMPLACQMQGDRATCVRPSVPVGDLNETGYTVTFPAPEATVSFPTNKPPSVCRYVSCGAGRACAVDFNGRAVCVSTTKTGIN